MACKNKFYDELKLEHLDYKPETLIVGTFDPELGEGNKAEWFYGRTESNCFWHVLPGLYGEASLIDAGANAWRQFCKDKKIAITEAISAIDDADLGKPEQYRALAGFSDDAIEYKFDDPEFVNIVEILQRHPSIRNVYFTRGITDAYWRHVWNPTMQYSSKNGLHERRLLTPTNDASYQHGAYNKQYPEAEIPLLEDYIMMKWKEEWHF